MAGGSGGSNPLGGDLFSLKVNFDDVLSALTRNPEAAVKLSNIISSILLLISASLNRNKEVVRENNDAEPKMLNNLTPAYSIFT